MFSFDWTDFTEKDLIELNKSKNPMVYGYIYIEKNNKKYSLEELLLREKPELAVMVGDRSYDKEAARYNQIPFVGCKYGYGKPEELSDCKYSVETALELSRIIDEIISARGGAD